MTTANRTDNSHRTRGINFIINNPTPRYYPRSHPAYAITSSIPSIIIRRPNASDNKYNTQQRSSCQPILLPAKISTSRKRKSYYMSIAWVSSLISSLPNSFSSSSATKVSYSSRFFWTCILNLMTSFNMRIVSVWSSSRRAFALSVSCSYLGYLSVTKSQATFR